MLQRLLDLAYALAGYLKGYLDASVAEELKDARSIIKSQKAVATAARDTRDERLRRMAARGRVRDIHTD